MAVKFILTLVLLQLVSAAPGPDPEPDPDTNVNVVQNVGVSCGCSKCPCDKDEPEPTTPIGDAYLCHNVICDGTLWNSNEILTGVCAPCYGYKDWLDLTKFGVIDNGCWYQPPHPHPKWECDCYINACSNCSCTTDKGIHGICADLSRSGYIPPPWINHGHNFGCNLCNADCDCYTPW